MTHKSLLIIGGGPVGLFLSLLLAQKNIPTTIIDQAIDKTLDARVLALSYSSYKLLKSLDCWDDSLTTLINQVEISHSGFGVGLINARDLSIPALGYTIKYSSLCASLLKQVKSSPLIELLAGKINKVTETGTYALAEYQTHAGDKLLTADLIIVAEGGNLNTGQLFYQQYAYNAHAIISQIKTLKPASDIAYERFSRKGPLVLLPNKNYYTCIWSRNTFELDEILANPQNLALELEQEFTKRLGGIIEIGPLASFPLQLKIVKSQNLKHLLLIGNSAHIVHPVSAQGLNLGFRDAVSFSQLYQKDYLNNTLHNYHHSRLQDINYIAKFTHILATSLDYELLLAKLAKSFGLVGFNACPSLRNSISRRLIFGA